MIGRNVGIGVGAVVGLLALTIVLGSWYTIDQGERGVVLRNGAFRAVAEPGLHFKLPFIDSVAYISIQSHKQAYEGIDGAGLATYSKDQQPADIRLSVNFRADPASVGHLYERFGSLENAVARLVDPQVYEEVKNVFGQYNAVTAVQERARLNRDIETAVRAGVGGEPGILIESVQIENIDFSEAYEQSIEARMLAEVEVQKLRQNAEREKVQAEIVVIQSKAEAERVTLNAKALGDQARLIGEGQADAIRARGTALKDNPLLIELTTAEKWDGTLPTTMVPGGAVPFVSVAR
jgi:regulator of protease activity HflC (stomatin/prohibitin superfamily)